MGQTGSCHQGSVQPEAEETPDESQGSGQQTEQHGGLLQDQAAEHWLPAGLPSR